MNFTTDYDKENPLTKKEGNLRWLNIQIDIARRDGDDEKLKKL